MIHTVPKQAESPVCVVHRPEGRGLDQGQSVRLSASALQVKAVKLGHILVIDEADKAPTNVTCILKTLVESGEMILADGRRIISGTRVDTDGRILLVR